MKEKLERNNLTALDGVYDVSPSPKVVLRVYCDMTRNGGGWTLIVSSHSDTWTRDKVLLYHEERPQLHKDYSILKFADLFKNTYLVNDTFNYRLEAEFLGEFFDSINF